MKRIGILFSGLLLSLSVAAQIYQWTDEHGQTHFTDKPRKGAKTVDLPPLQTYSPKDLPRLKSSSGESTTSDLSTEKQKIQKKVAYESIQINQPAHDEAVRANNGDVTFSVSVEPSLREGDKIAIFVGGSNKAEAEGTSVIVGNLNRGTHQAVAKILDASGQTLLESAPVTFTVVRHSIIHSQLNVQKHMAPKIKAYIKNAVG